MAQKKVYDKEFKIQAVKLGREIGFSKAAKELGVNVDTLYGWNKRAKDARLDLGPGTQTHIECCIFTFVIVPYNQFLNNNLWKLTKGYFFCLSSG